jgi:hypothetical protein
MVAPIIMGAAAIAARLAAKKVAQEAAKKAAKTAAANARGLKAANAKVSKNNAGQTGSKLKSDVLKNSPPARANRTRGGSLRTLRAEGKTGPNYQIEIQGKMYSLPAAEKKMAALRKLQGGKN